MALRTTTLVFAFVCLFLLTEARKFDFLPSEDDAQCHYLGTCANETANEDCMKKCSQNGFNSAGAKCRATVTPTCCCFKDKKSTVNPSDDQSCHYMGTCASRDDCITQCSKNGFTAGAQCTQIETVVCCCLKG